jgi:hypothetical protein
MNLNFLRNPQIREGFANIFGQAIVGYGKALFVDTVNGRTGADGLSWETACKTMGAALAKARTSDSIYVSGDIREELVGSNLVFDLKIIGVGTLHHPDVPGTGYHPGKNALERRDFPCRQKQVRKDL